MKNFTIVIPDELNFLVFINNVYNKKKFPKVPIPHEDFNENFKQIMIDLWEEKIRGMYVNKNYVQREDFYKKNLLILFKENASKNIESLLQYFDSWWFNQAPKGNKYLLELLFHGTINYYEINNKMQTKENSQILILFDYPPEECKTEILKQNIYVIPVETFLT
ncbi:MAG TPA: hypothetical protein VKZ77_00695 [Bacillaceae bacterium]|nr:hypothetical protein [Paenibacillus bovis]HLU20982.1 hypothetical protein [Bacillaceae bacterium]